MLNITCTYERLTEGKYKLSPHEDWRISNPKPITLEGNWAAVWEQMLHMASLSEDSQVEMLRQLNKKHRAKLMNAISLLQRGGFLHTGADFFDDLENRADGVPRLYKLHLEVTHRCNFSCKACYLGPRLLPASAPRMGEATTEQWVQLIEDAADLGCLSAVVTGGEPLLRKDIVAILEALSDNGITTTINTNGSPITDALAEKLRYLLIGSVEVTIYGYDRQSSAEYTGNSPGFEASLAGVRRLAENMVPVTAKYFTTVDNQHGLERLEKALEPYNVRVASIGHSIHADIFDGRQSQHRLKVLNMETPRVVQKTKLPCHPTGTVLNIEPDGSIRACPKVGVHFGNVFRDGLKQVWSNSLDVNAFRSYWINHCETEGYVKGAEKGSLCPASALLSKKDGLAAFRAGWETWRKHYDPAGE